MIEAIPQDANHSSEIRNRKPVWNLERNKEMSHTRSGTNINPYQRPKCKERKNLFMSSLLKHSGISVMAWTCMSASGTASIIIIDDVIHGGSRINSEVYRNI